MSEYSRENPPPFCDENGDFVAADFVCDVCGTEISVAFHPAFLGNMSEIQQWLTETAACKCTPGAQESFNEPPAGE